MSASDTIEADAACPHCGDVYYLRCETLFFEPTYAEQRTLTPSVVKQLDQMPGHRSTWSRVRPPPRPRLRPQPGERFTILADVEHMVRCACGCPCVPVLHFVRGPGTIMLERVELVDAKTDVAAQVDFVQAGR